MVDDHADKFRMKSYEFYILLGKYKRNSITLREFKRFETAIKQSRSFRYSYYDATGETVPLFNTTLSRIERSNRKHKTPHSHKEDDNRLPDSPISSELVEDTFRNHPEFKRVRSKRRKKTVWHHVVTQLIKDNSIPILVALSILVTLVTVVAIAIDRQSKNHTYAITTQTQTLNTIPSEPESPAQPTVPSTHPEAHAKEMETLITEQPSTVIQVDNLTAPKIPTTGLEDMIVSSLDEMFLEPENELSKIEIPILESIKTK